jgi:hypothetical protein
MRAHGSALLPHTTQSPTTEKAVEAFELRGSSTFYFGRKLPHPPPELDVGTNIPASACRLPFSCWYQTVVSVVRHQLHLVDEGFERLSHEKIPKTDTHENVLNAYFTKR